MVDADGKDAGGHIYQSKTQLDLIWIAKPQSGATGKTGEHTGIKKRHVVVYVLQGRETPRACNYPPVEVKLLAEETRGDEKKGEERRGLIF